jgi:hypothetical protein
MKLLLIVFITLKLTVTFGFDCKKLTKDQIYNQADLVFLGSVIYVSDTIAGVRIIEWFKGNAKDTVQWFISKGEVIPSINTTWLIYGHNTNIGNSFYIQECTGSKGFTAPYSIQDDAIPPPPTSEMVSMSLEGRVLHRQMLFDRALSELYFDIASLRARKLEREIALLQQKYDKLMKGQESASDSRAMNWSMILLLVVSMVSLVLNLRGQMVRP